MKSDDTITAVMRMFGHNSKKQFDIATYANAEKRTLLVDYYDRTVGTPMKMPYYELVLYTDSDTQCLLEEYRNGDTKDETVSSYLIPLQGAQEILTAVRKTGMDTWNRHSGIAICGKSYVCKFPDGEGGCIRVTSDNMPEHGARAFGSVKVAIQQWLREEYRIKP